MSRYLNVYYDSTLFNEFVDPRSDEIFYNNYISKYYDGTIEINFPPASNIILTITSFPHSFAAKRLITVTVRQKIRSGKFILLYTLESQMFRIRLNNYDVEYK